MSTSPPEAPASDIENAEPETTQVPDTSEIYLNLKELFERDFLTIRK